MSLMLTLARNGTLRSAGTTRRLGSLCASKGRWSTSRPRPRGSHPLPNRRRLGATTDRLEGGECYVSPSFLYVLVYEYMLDDWSKGLLNMLWSIVVMGEGPQD